MAGIEDCYTSARGHTRTMGNFLKATYFALQNTYGYLSPDMWTENKLELSPIERHSEFLAKGKK